MKDLVTGLAVLAVVAFILAVFVSAPWFVLLLVTLLAAPFVGRWVRDTFAPN